MAKLELETKQTMEDRKIQAEHNRIREEKLRQIREEQERIDNEIKEFKNLIIMLTYGTIQRSSEDILKRSKVLPSQNNL